MTNIFLKTICLQCWRMCLKSFLHFWKRKWTSASPKVSRAYFWVTASFGTLKPSNCTWQGRVPYNFKFWTLHHEWQLGYVSWSGFIIISFHWAKGEAAKAVALEVLNFYLFCFLLRFSFCFFTLKYKFALKQLRKSFTYHKINAPHNKWISSEWYTIYLVLQTNCWTFDKETPRGIP